MNKPEKYKYLFIDMEWNQMAGTTDLEHREPLQIALIGTNESMESVKIFSKSIRLKNAETLTQNTCRIMHTCKENIMSARTEEEVFESISQTFSAYKFIVVWTQDTYDLFKITAERTGIKLPGHKVLVLQDILGYIAMPNKKKLSFESALKGVGISYVPHYLHYSKHDVKYLYELFMTLYTKYSALTEKECCIVNTRTKIIHSRNCRYAGSKNCKPVIGAGNLIFSGYSFCKKCDPAQNSPKIEIHIEPKPVKINKNKKEDIIQNKLKILPLTEENIKQICGHFGLQCNVSSDIIFLKTRTGYWRIFFNGNKVKHVFHGNFRNGGINKRKFDEGFHKQNVRSKNLYEVVRYIYFHDNNLFNSKKSHMDILFDMIRQEAPMENI